MAIRVRNLTRAEAFYREVLGLEVGLRDPDRPWVFLLAGEAGMIVLQEESGAWPTQHFAFTVAPEDMDRAQQALGEHGVAHKEPVTHEWIPAQSLYFQDPDGHDLEFCAPL